MVSMKRIDKFLRNDEIQSNIKDQQNEAQDGEYCLEVRGNFSWGFTSNQTEKNKKKKKVAVKEEKKDEKRKLSKFIALKDIDLQIQKGEFVCIIGDVGSGKSSLLQSVIGDLIYVP